MNHYRSARFVALIVIALILASCAILIEETDSHSEDLTQEYREMERLQEAWNEDREQQPNSGAACGPDEEEVEPGICSYLVMCDDAASCEAWGAAMLDDMEQGYGELTYAEEWEVDEEESEREEQIIASYAVNGNEIALRPSNEDEEYYAWLWERFAWIIPSDYREMVVRFEVFDHADTMAYVKQDEEDDTNWIYAANRVQATYETERIMTDIHEFGHLLSFNAEQVDPYVEEDDCETQMLDEGCAFEESYIYRFYRLFWQDGGSEDEYDYVTDYAMSSVDEDFAESWAYFVMTDRPEGDSVVDRKISFFYDYDELIMLKARILGRSVSWIERNAE